MIAARFVLEAPRYSPMELMRSLKVPVLFISAAQDALCPHEVGVRHAPCHITEAG